MSADLGHGGWARRLAGVCLGRGKRKSQDGGEGESAN